MSRRLHIGGKVRKAGWEVLNATADPCVDHVLNAKDLSSFADHTFSEIYASHVLEHFDYKDELESTLKEWARVLEPGGKLYISVPDLDILAKIFLLKDQLDTAERFFVMRMIFGGHVDRYDYHVTGLNFEFLVYFLSRSGFTGITKVEAFNLFEDTSAMKYKGVAISLNVVSVKA